MNAATDKFAGFTDFVTSIDEVTSVIGEPMEAARSKITDRLDEICRAYIAASPFCFISSSNQDGHLDISPKGNPVQ